MSLGSCLCLGRGGLLHSALQVGYELSPFAGSWVEKVPSGNSSGELPLACEASQHVCVNTEMHRTNCMQCLNTAQQFFSVHI